MRSACNNLLANRWIYMVAMCLFFSCKNDLKKLPKDNKEQDYTKDVADTVSVILSENSWTKLKIDAPLFIRNEVAKPPYIEMPKGLKAEFYDDSLKTETTLTAKYGRYYTVNKNIIVKDSVLVVNKDGNRLFSNELIYNQNTEKFYSDLDVYIYGNEFIIYGDGFESNRDFTKLSFKRQKGLIPVQKGTFPK